MLIISIHSLFIYYYVYWISGACPGGGAKGLPPPPPLEIEKQKNKYFFSRKYHFLTYFLSWDPTPEILKSKKKKLQILGPSPYEFLDTRLDIVYYSGYNHI